MHTYIRTFNKQSGNFLVTSSSSTGWKDTVRGVDVGLVTERIKLTSCRGQETTQEVNYMGCGTGEIVHIHRASNEYYLVG